MNKGVITQHNSMILKGWGIFAMLIHHLFYSESSTQLFDDIFINEIGITQTIGIWCKVCVAMFVFLSGYGLAVSYSYNFNLQDFYFKRFKKLYFNYWIIWLIFVPIGIFIFDRNFNEVYGDHMIIKVILEFLGIYNLFGGLGYNPTWWFYSCIIPLYIIFPLLIKLFRERLYILIFCSSICIVPLTFVPLIDPIRSYLFSFVLGIALANIPATYIDRIHLTELIIVLFLLSVARVFGNTLNCIIDGLICFTASLVLSKCTLPRLCEKVFVSLGKHSMNIFLFHTFIYYYWFTDYIYSTRNPIIIFIELMAVCYLISVSIEFIKSKTGFYKIVKK